MTTTPRCAAVKDMSPFFGKKRCGNTARYGEWCYAHAHSVGGWQFVSPEDYAVLQAAKERFGARVRP